MYIPYTADAELDELDGDGLATANRSIEVDAALLITGTAVGGGFLALPYFATPGGAEVQARPQLESTTRIQSLLVNRS